MTIAVNTKTTENNFDECDNFIFETFYRIIKLHPQHTFILISEKTLNDALTSFENVINVSIGQQNKNPLLWYVWYNIKIPAILKKYKVELFISYNIASLTSPVAQYIIIPDLSFIHQPSLFRKSSLLFYKTFVPRSIKKSQAVLTFSELSKKNIIKQYKTKNDKIKVIYKGVSANFKEISYEEKEEVKAKYAAGNEYFVYTGEIGSHKNLLNLLKAFSAFKKRQKSSMKLVISGKQGWKYKEFIEELRLFRFKDDVNILADPMPQEILKIIAAAYAMVCPSFYEGVALPPLEAMQSGIPVIGSSKGAIPETGGDAMLYADTENFREIAVKMMQVFRDENLRNQLIDKGKIHVKKFNWDITADLLWDMLELHG
jgi:glycosyltransferase involved in cell wall biosynthesis